MSPPCADLHSAQAIMDDEIRTLLSEGKYSGLDLDEIERETKTMMMRIVTTHWSAATHQSILIVFMTIIPKELKLKKRKLLK